MQMAPLVRVLLTAVYLAAASFAIAAPVSPPARTNPSGNLVAVDELLEQVQDALGLANEKAPKDHAQLDSVTLGLQTVAVQEKGGKITFFIFEFGREIRTTSTSTITLTLSRPETAKAKAEGLSAPPSFASALADLIVAAWRAVNAGRDKIEGLQPTKVSCEISFGVNKDSSGKLALAFVPVSAEAGKVSSRQAVQTITVTFKSADQKEAGSPS
jgi:hypothetical protein